MKNKDIKDSIRMLLKNYKDIEKQNNKDIKDNNITLSDYLVSMIDNGEYLIKKFKELLDWQE